MSTYEDVISLVKRLPLPDQVRLREALVTVSPPRSALVSAPVEVEGTDETIAIEDVLESEAALQDYWTGRDAILNGSTTRCGNESGV